MWQIENYARGWVDLGPFRVGLKDPLPWEGPVERKWFNFWRVKTPKDLTLIGHGNRIYRKLTGAPPPEPKEPPKDADGNNLVLWRFDLFGGLDHNLNIPVVKGSNWLVEQGLLENPKRLTIPMLMLLSWPILALPRNGLHSLNQYLEDRKKRHELKFNYRFEEIREDLEKKTKALEKARQDGADPKEIKRLEEAEEQAALNTVDSLQDSYNDYDTIRNEMKERYKKAHTPQEVAALDQERVLRLCDLPIFADIPASLGVTSQEELLSPAIFPKALALVSLRESLNSAYSIIPSLIAGGRKEAALGKVDGISDTVDAIKKSPVYRELRPYHDSGKLSDDEFQRALMEDAFWTYDRFGVWDQFEGPPPEVDKNKKLTGRKLNPARIQRELIDDEIRKIPD